MEFFTSAWDGFISLFSGEPRPMVTVDIIVWSLFIGFVIAAFIVIYNKLFIGSFVNKLIKNEALTEESALSTEEIGYGKAPTNKAGEKESVFTPVGHFIKSSLISLSFRKGGTLRRIVHMAGDTESERCRGKVSEGRFYIPKDNVHRAETVYGKKDLTTKSVILALIGFVVVAAVFAVFVVPNLVTMFTNFISGLTPDDNIL